MPANFVALIIGPLLLAGGGTAPNRAEPDYGGQELEALYRHVGTGREQASLTVRYATSRAMEVGWRIGVRQFAKDDASITGRQVAVGPLWAVVAGRRGRAAILRVEVNPWFAVASNLKDATFPDPAIDDAARRIKLPFGVTASVLLSAPMRLGKGVRIAPGVGYTGTDARASGPAVGETAGAVGTQTRWDWQTGWRATLPVWLGAQQRFRMELGLTRPEHDGKYLLLERTRWDASLAWRF